MLFTIRRILCQHISKAENEAYLKAKTAAHIIKLVSQIKPISKTDWIMKGGKLLEIDSNM